MKDLDAQEEIINFRNLINPARLKYIENLITKLFKTNTELLALKKVCLDRDVERYLEHVSNKLHYGHGRLLDHYAYKNFDVSVFNTLTDCVERLTEANILIKFLEIRKHNIKMFTLGH